MEEKEEERENVIDSPKALDDLDHATLKKIHKSKISRSEFEGEGAKNFFILVNCLRFLQVFLLFPFPPLLCVWCVCLFVWLSGSTALFLFNGPLSFSLEQPSPSNDPLSLTPSQRFFPKMFATQSH